MFIKNFNRVTLHKEYRNMTKERFEKICNRVIAPIVDYVEEDKDNIMSLIFAPDPLTGFPRSDLALIMSKDASPEVSQYIRDTLMRPISQDGPSGAPDADTALDTLRGRNESFTVYAERIKGIIEKYNAKTE